MPPEDHSHHIPVRVAIPGRRKRNLLVTIAERLYDKCAGYNLRYCPFRGFIAYDNYFNNAMRDLLTLCCFILANFVVFLTILTRMTFQICFLILDSAKWLSRTGPSKSLVSMNSLRSHHIVTPAYDVDDGTIARTHL